MEGCADQLHGRNPRAGPARPRRNSGHRGRCPCTHQPDLAVRRPEPDLWLGPVASGVPARVYVGADGDLHSTGALLGHHAPGADKILGTADDPKVTMATWGDLKANAASFLGIKITDYDVNSVPLLATDPYGNFIAGPHGLPQLVVKFTDGTQGLVEGNWPSRSVWVCRATLSPSTLPPARHITQSSPAAPSSMTRRRPPTRSPHRPGRRSRRTPTPSRAIPFPSIRRRAITRLTTTSCWTSTSWPVTAG